MSKRYTATITDELRVSHCGAPGAYVGLIKRGNDVVWRCPHKHANRDSDTRNTAARSCAGLVLAALRDPDGVRAHIRAMQSGVPHFQYEWQAKEWQLAIARREWSLEAAAEILTAEELKRPPRMATCGACGAERIVDNYMKRHRRETQYTSRPDQPTDSFYCGCEDDERWMDGW